jgi:hypothetical protein
MDKTEALKTGKIVIILLLLQLLMTAGFLAVGYNNTIGYNMEAWHVLIVDIGFIVIVMFIFMFGD